MKTKNLDSLKPEPECCPEFNPVPWSNQEFEWESKSFIRDKVLSFYYMPLNFGAVMRRMNAKVAAAQAEVPDWLCLSEHSSKWKMNVLLAVNKEIPDASNVKLSGKFFSKVYEGPYSDTGKWTDDFKNAVHEKGLKVDKWYMWYTTCPKCAKKYGKNYVVIMGRLS